MSNDQKYKSITAKRFKLAVQMSKHAVLQEIATKFGVGVDTVTHWQLPQRGIPPRRLVAVATLFKVKPWVFENENLSDDNFIVIIDDPSQMDKYIPESNVNASSPEAISPSTQVNCASPQSLSDKDASTPKKNAIARTILPLDSSLPEDEVPITGKRLASVLEFKRVKMVEIAQALNVSIRIIMKWKKFGIPVKYISNVTNILNVGEMEFIDKGLSHKRFMKIIRESTLQKATQPTANEEKGASEPKFVRMVGTVIEWDEKKGVGSIMPEGGKDSLHVSRKNIHKYTNNAEKNLLVGESLSFIRSFNKQDHAMHVLWLPPILRFAVIDDLLFLLHELAEKKIIPGECWNYKNPAHSMFSVLRDYIFNVFRRLEQEDSEQTDKKKKKIRIGHRTKKNRLAIFDTGLVNRTYLNIYAVFANNCQLEIGKPYWKLLGFCSNCERLDGIDYLQYFKELPDPAEYFKDPADLVFNPKLRLDLTLTNMPYEELRRWPPNILEKIPSDMRNPFQIRNFLNGLLQTALERALRRIHYDYKTAVPRYSFRSKKIELLLPLCFDDQSIVDSALAIQKEGQSYVYVSIVSVDRAYGQARLIAPPHSDWLDPKVFSERSSSLVE